MVKLLRYDHFKVVILKKRYYHSNFYLIKMFDVKQ